MTQPQAHIVRHASAVSADARAAAYGHRGCVLWLTGLSGSGKSTIAHALEARLVEGGCHAYVLDGDNVRHGLNSDLGFGAEDRAENIRRIGEVAALFCDAGTITLVSFISPYRADRRLARGKVPNGQFFEIFIDTPIDECEARDPKGLYRKARSGEIPEFTGISAPYEAPDAPELRLPTATLPVDECVARIEALLVEQAIIAPIPTSP